MSSLIVPESKQAGANEPEIRLLVCGQCKTIEELDDFDGPADRDEELAIRVSRHKSAGIPHAPASLMRVAASVWNSPVARDQIREEIAKRLSPNSHTGFGAETYALMDNLKADAMACWQDHLRTPNCSDYKSDAKRLAPGTSKERKELGLSPVYDAADKRLTRYLCEHCPVHSLVVQAARKKAGMYDS